ncbi:hypothetical protein KKD03_04060 [Patescibacteria group bacterium]|nr:hypothetical protein [Patescibacteria group bacterium]
MLKKFKTKIDKVIEIIALNFVFILGIGLTFLFSRLVNKKFLNNNQSKTSWKEYLSNKNSVKMY